MLDQVASEIQACSPPERAKLARFLAAQAEQNQADRPGASRVLSWLGVVAVGRQPHAISLEDISPAERRYLRDLSRALVKVVGDESVLHEARTPADLEAEPHAPLLSVWRELGDTMERSLS